MFDIKKMLFYSTLFITTYPLNSLMQNGPYTHIIINNYDKDVKVVADTIGGRNTSVTVPSGATAPQETLLETPELCVRGFKAQAYDNMQQKKWWRWFRNKWRTLGEVKTESVVTDILGEPAVARGCMNYQLTIEKNGSLSLKRLGVPKGRRF